MGIQIPLYKKETLIPNSRIERDSHEIPNDYQLIPFYAVIMIPNFVGTISKAIRRNENSFAIIFVFIYVGFVLSRFFLSKYVSLPKNEKLMQQLWLKLDIWFLYTVITFGFVYQFADFSPLQTTVAMYMVVSVCSLILLFVFVIVDVIEFWKIWRYGEDHETQLSENPMTDAGELNSYSVSIWEKV
ncbi:unnamed protein product [Lactuca saligna]|uniref:Uncharacterized protein n=1 Tax=Lactuca saligna TaxID=75948 RepID=A0AA35Z0K5_LACSI|nr:unnamed protein product [Lactuca saligna]